MIPPEPIYGPPIDPEQEAVYQMRAEQNKAADLTGKNPIPLIAVPDARLVSAAVACIRARNDVLQPGDPQRSAHGLSYGEHAAFLSIEPNFDHLKIPDELWGTKLPDAVQTYFSGWVNALWRSFLSTDVLLKTFKNNYNRLWDENSKPHVTFETLNHESLNFLNRQFVYRPALKNVTLNTQSNRITAAVSKARIQAEQNDWSTKAEIADFCREIQIRVRLAMDVFALDPIALEISTGGVPPGCFPISIDSKEPRLTDAERAEFHDSQRSRIDLLERIRTAAERGVSRESFVSFIRSILVALGYEEFDVGVLSVTQALSRHCSALVVPASSNSERPTLFLPMSHYGTSRLMTTANILSGIASSLARYHLTAPDWDFSKVDDTRSYSHLFGEILEEMQGLRIVRDASGRIDVSNPFREAYHRVKNGIKMYFSLSPREQGDFSDELISGAIRFSCSSALSYKQFLQFLARNESLLRRKRNDRIMDLIEPYSTAFREFIRRDMSYWESRVEFDQKLMRLGIFAHETFNIPDGDLEWPEYLNQQTSVAQTHDWKYGAEPEEVVFTPTL